MAPAPLPLPIKVVAPLKRHGDKSVFITKSLAAAGSPAAVLGWKAYCAAATRLKGCAISRSGNTSIPAAFNPTEPPGRQRQATDSGETSPRNLREVRNRARRLADQSQQRQAIGADRGVLVVDEHVGEEAVNGAAQLGERFHRRSEIFRGDGI